VADEIVADLASRDKPRDPDGVQSFQPRQSYRGPDQRNVCRRIRRNVHRAAAHHLDAPADDVRSQTLPPTWQVTDSIHLGRACANFIRPRVPFIDRHAGRPRLANQPMERCPARLQKKKGKEPA
jgi:hypothetical protein